VLIITKKFVCRTTKLIEFRTETHQIFGDSRVDVDSFIKFVGKHEMLLCSLHVSILLIAFYFLYNTCEKKFIHHNFCILFYISPFIVDQVEPSKSHV
jgi:hypothetical protein